MGSLTLEKESAVAEETVLDELVPHGLRSDHPIPVLDSDGALVGEIPLDALAQAMAGVADGEMAGALDNGGSA